MLDSASQLDSAMALSRVRIGTIAEFLFNLLYYWMHKNNAKDSCIYRGGTLLTQKIFDAQNFNAGILTPGLLSLDGI